MAKKNENMKETEEEKNIVAEKKKTTKSSTAKKTTSTKKTSNTKSTDAKKSASKKPAKAGTTVKTSTEDSKIQANSRLADLMTTIETKEVKSNKSKKVEPKKVEEKAKTTKASVKTEKTENAKTKKDESKDKNTKKPKSKKETTKKRDSVVEKNKSVKKNNVSLQVSQEDILEGIKKEVKKRKEIPTGERRKIKKDMIKSFLSAIFIIIYFAFIILGYKNIEEQVFFTDLRIFSIVMVVLSIIVFEKAYKNDNGETCLIGIELMVSAVITLVAMFIFLKMRNMFVTILSIIIGGYAVYYIVKLLILYKRLKSLYYKKANDIRKIIKDDDDE